MKKVFVVIVIALFTLNGYSQVKGRDHITMKSDGKVYWIRSGKQIKMNIDVPLKNGSVVNYRGEITSKDGEVTQLEKGQVLMMDGTMGKKKKA